jgi:DNA-binding NtrC family response regulator
VFEAANDGTLFRMKSTTSPGLQARLLRALQEREIVRVGDSHPMRVNVRVVAATNRELRGLLEEGTFREDLYYRLAVYPLQVAPLRERASDIPLLVEHALAQIGARLPGTRNLTCSPLAMRLLRRHAWPGNVRQLLAALESAAISATHGRIEAQHLPDDIRDGTENEALTPRYRASAQIEDERAVIEAALAHAGGTLSRTADLLGMGRTTLWRKMRAYGIESMPRLAADS